ncbi:MAG: HAMP domain-containing protein [Nitrospirae bacterium]|nr:HAMP domain-containing protein [Nitrospirota bacterium]
MTEPAGAPRRASGLAKAGIVALLLVLAGSLALLSRIHGQGGSNILVVTLVNINLILVVLVGLVLSRNLLKWVFEEGRLSSLRTRLVAAFLGFSLIPTALMFVVASGLLTDSVNGWFSPQIEGAMQGAVEVARERYREMHERVGADAAILAAMAERRGPSPDRAALSEWLERQRGAWGLSGLAVMYGPARDRVVAAGTVGTPPPPPDGTETVAVAGGELVRAGVPLGDWGYLVAERTIPAAAIATLRQITADYENFSQLAAYKEPIKKGYRLSFLLIALVILFSASWFGFYIARGITTPVLNLVAGTREVAAGNLAVQLRPASRDEVGELVDGFNTMTAQLARNKDELTHANRSLTASNRELEERRAYMEAILVNADTGVIALDPAGRVSLFNRAAANILSLDPERVKGRGFAEAFADPELAPVAGLIGPLHAGERDREQELHLVRHGRPRTLQVHARRVLGPDGANLGQVLVFSDMTELIRVQKEAAWREVAQRLAHEIKNPLTPIQLSVQRLKRRYSRDGQPLPDVVEETANTILEEVGGLKRLVDEFSQFARMPEVNLATDDIWGLVGEVAGLYRQAYPGVAIRVDAGPVGQLAIDKKQMRRVFTNLFENAIQVMGGRGEVRVTGRVVPDGRAEIRVADTGPGVAEGEESRVFQPYFSRREGGTGLGLAIVSRIMEEHHGRIHVERGDPAGAVFVLSFPAT